MQKMTKNSTELGRTFATLMMDMGFRHSLMEVTSAEEFKQLMRERAQKLAKHQALPEHRRSTIVVQSVFDEPEGVSGDRKDKTVYLVCLFCFVFAKHIIVGRLFRNIYPSLQYSSHSRIHTSLCDFVLTCMGLPC